MLFRSAPAVLWHAHAAQLHQDYGNTFGVVSGGDSKWGSWVIWRQGAFWADLLRLDVTGTVGYAGLALALVGLLTSAVAWLGFRRAARAPEVHLSDRS